MFISIPLNRRQATRRSWLASFLVSAVLLVFVAPAHAETMTATHPSLICTSPDALGRLILHGGQSRIGTASEAPGDRQAMVAGGCVEVSAGTHVEAQSVRTNTSVVTYDAQDGRGPRAFVVPNVNFVGVPSLASTATAQHVPAARDPSEAFWQRVDQTCPTKHWRSATDASLSDALLEKTDLKFTPTQQRKIREDSQACDGLWMGCRPQAYLHNALQFGKADQLVKQLCSMEP